MTSAGPKGFDAPRYVSQPMLPDLDDYVDDLRSMWESRTLTNLGPFHRRFEAALQERIGMGHVSVWSNGTNALLGALMALDLRGEVVVTPFTFPATVHAIAALGLEPVFADVDPVTMTISPASVADRVTERTSAIVATHIYGTPCDVDALDAIAREHDLRIVYDGAHSFGRARPVFPDGDAVLGDVTMLSFHATKLFHSVEGGALIARDPEVDRRLRRSRNFGIASEDEVEGVGLNGKMSELHAAMGLRVLEMLDGEILQRRRLGEVYERRLSGIEGLRIVAGLGPSAQYLVLRVDRDGAVDRDAVHAALRERNVVSRRYFHPLCSVIAPYDRLPSARDLPNAERAADECLALPFHGGLTTDDVERICDAIAWRMEGGTRG
ncbi:MULTISPECIES: DegT/DnrJ/EryC1/StrS family aminotransferase [unclassified Agrococcus]|uniref:DegT/DnrJ/EryC1/StrS family aminotransferase n=1 Tax=unclassified Agrococcus TaxID=2615065 RepID=UPI00360DDA0B